MKKKKKGAKNKLRNLHIISDDVFCDGQRRDVLHFLGENFKQKIFKKSREKKGYKKSTGDRSHHRRRSVVYFFLWNVFK